MKTTREIRVVIAEDDAMVARFTQTELETIGMKVVGTAADGAQAVAMTTELKPDVVLMDITMPELDGIEAAAALQVGCPTPVVILTAHDAAELVERATAAGVGAFVIKPPRADELERAITIAIARHADLMELGRLNLDLQQALAEVKTLTGLLPICSGCKKIRDDKGYWKQIEIYIMQHTDAKFTHGMCPECIEKYYPGILGEHNPASPA
jgi:AmiR/NasT family two-component response regulator